MMIISLLQKIYLKKKNDVHCTSNVNLHGNFCTCFSLEVWWTNNFPFLHGWCASDLAPTETASGWEWGWGGELKPPGKSPDVSWERGKVRRWWQPRTPVEGGSWNPMKKQGFKNIPKGGWEWDFWAINSIGGRIFVWYQPPDIDFVRWIDYQLSVGLIQLLNLYQLGGLILLGISRVSLMIPLCRFLVPEMLIGDSFCWFWLIWGYSLWTSWLRHWTSEEDLFPFWETEQHRVL